MSDLDADLYGDLYDTETPTESESKEASQDFSQKAPQPSTSAYSVPKPIASTQAPTQQIPTYEEPHELRDHPVRQTISVAGHSIRPSEMKEEGKMFIGGLNWETTDEGLQDYFSQFGRVEACTIMRDPTGRSRCFAFLTFEDPASVNAVMVQEHVLDGKIIDPKRAIPREEHQRATKLFIGGLAATVTSESMRDFFSQFGKVVDSTVMLDRETGRSKGFGFVSLEDVNVQPFLGFGNLEIDGKLIDVKLAEPRYKRDNFAEDGSGGGNFAAAATGGASFNQQGNFSAQTGMGNTPFDPQALANLYTRMFQMAGGSGLSGMNMNMGNMGMNPMMGMMNAMGGVSAMGRGMGMGRGGMMQGNIPRGPRASTTPPTGPMAGAGVGPQRGPRGGHHFHPYSR